MKLACVGPLAPLRTGVAHFSESLLPFLAERCEIKLFCDPYPPAPTIILRKFSAAPIGDLASEASQFDAVLYHMGNHYRFHRDVFEMLMRVPGIVILHDCVLNHFFAKYALEKGNFGVFRKLFEACYGDRCGDEVRGFLEGTGDPYEFPMAGIVAKRSRGTIVMSEYGARIVRKEAQGAGILKINHPYFPPSAAEAASNRIIEGLKVSPETFVVALIGEMTRAKRPDVAIEAFTKFRKSFPESVLLLAGRESSSLPIRRIVEQRPDASIRYLGYLEESELYGLMDRADAFINLRYPSSGEMSGALLHMLGRGKAVVVSNYAQFAEFPDSTCVKINMGDDEVDDLAEKLLELARDDDRRRRIGEAAREHIAAHHTREPAADAIVQFARDNSAAEPLLADDMIRDLLLPDPLMKKYRQMFVYNMKRFRKHSKEQGAIRAAWHALGRKFAKT